MGGKNMDCSREGCVEVGESLTPVPAVGVYLKEYGGSNVTFITGEEKKRSGSERSIDLTLDELDKLAGCVAVAGRGISTPRSEKLLLGSDNTTSSNVKRKR
ncbi:hypothetical protein ABEB36_004396 [Hypothenemus hampei]|uniref:Uncharacterized protein n=1 Tax=Hypothenemus hampei TaxID=57062 RepID=A0ABD1F393_HYPHA